MVAVSPSPASLRADALAAWLHLAAGLQPGEEISAELAAGLSSREWEALRAACGEADFELANVCLQFERELLAREYAALERLGALLPPAGRRGVVLTGLPRTELARIAVELVALGWLRDVPRGSWWAPIRPPRLWAPRLPRPALARRGGAHRSPAARGAARPSSRPPRRPTCQDK